MPDALHLRRDLTAMRDSVPPSRFDEGLLDAAECAIDHGQLGQAESLLCEAQDTRAEAND